jgi:membrane protease subunit HflK
MYIDAMQQIYTNVTKVMIETKQGSLLYLPLDKIMQQVAQGGVVPEPPPAAVTPMAPTSPGVSTDARTRDSGRTRERETR